MSLVKTILLGRENGIRARVRKAILGGGSQDFIANAIYDQFFRTSDQGLGSTLALLLVAVGSLLVGIVFTLFGAGTLAMGRARR